MTKRELAAAVAEKLGYTHSEAAAVVQAALDAVVHALAEGQRLEIRDFGVFEVKRNDARMGRNPRTGEAVAIAEKRIARFKPGKALKTLVESGAGSPCAAPRPSSDGPEDQAAGSPIAPHGGEGQAPPF